MLWEKRQQRTRLRLVHSHGGISLAVQSLALLFVVALDQLLFLAVALLRLVRLETEASGSGARPGCAGVCLLQGRRLLVVDLLLLLIRVVGLLARGRRQGVGVILRRHGDFCRGRLLLCNCTSIGDGNLGNRGSSRRWMGLGGFWSGSN